MKKASKAALSDYLRTGSKTRGINPQNTTGEIKTNTIKGSPRFGQTYIEAVVDGQKVHRYALDGSQDVRFAPVGTSVSKNPKQTASVAAGLPAPRKGKAKAKTDTRTAMRDFLRS